MRGIKDNCVYRVIRVGKVPMLSRTTLKQNSDCLDEIRVRCTRKAKNLETDLVMMQVAQLSHYRLCLNVKWYEPVLALLQIETKNQNTNYNIPMQIPIKNMPTHILYIATDFHSTTILTIISR